LLLPAQARLEIDMVQIGDTWIARDTPASAVTPTPVDAHRVG
jgi:hypothetical protein